MVLNNFTDSSNRTLEQYLIDFLGRNPKAPVVVTGLSLGGCQTTVMALDLFDRLPEGTQIVPNSFAAPTAGNARVHRPLRADFPFRSPLV